MKGIEYSHSVFFISSHLVSRQQHRTKMASSFG